MKKFRAVIVSDIHYGRDVGNKLGKSAPALLRKFVRFANEQKPDVVIDLGDRISLQSRDQDEKNLRRLTRHFNRIAAPRIHLMGNHDVKNLTPEENARILGTRGDSYSMDVGGFRLIVWNANVTPYPGNRKIMISEIHLDWLRREVAAADRPFIVLTHIPLDYTGTPEQKKLNGAGELYYKRYGGTRDVRKILEQGGRNIINLAGDHHINSLTSINDAYYFVMNSMTQRAHSTGKASGAYALLEIEGDKIKIEVYGADRISHRLKIPQNRL